MGSNQLEKEFKFYLDNQDELVKKYNGKVLVIKDQTIIGSYDTDWEALKETQKIHKIGTFLVHKCGPGEDNYTQTYHSRVWCPA